MSATPRSQDASGVSLRGSASPGARRNSTTRSSSGPAGACTTIAASSSLTSRRASHRTSIPAARLESTSSNPSSNILTCGSYRGLRGQWRRSHASESVGLPQLTYAAAQPSGNPATIALPNATALINGATPFYLAVYARNNKLPYTMNSTVDIQWQPRNDLAIDIGYVNALGRQRSFPSRSIKLGLRLPQIPCVARRPFAPAQGRRCFRSLTHMATPCRARPALRLQSVCQ